MGLARAQKQEIVAELKEKLREAKAVFVADHTGIPVAQLTELRRRLRSNQSQLKVAKNTLIRIAAQEVGLEELVPFLKGPVSLAFCFADPAVTAKILADFNKEYKLLEIKGGVLGKKALTPDQVKALADLPPYEVLIGKVVGGMKAPLYGLVGVLSGTIRKLVYVLEAIKEKQATAS
ncbi:50S ribosomal protein L10 [Ammonifex thiophilus]|uniref:Large ribosomal subunit protein uL10 n=1 Tax=Ammonifex thiophilus TaxID=444093 RepID=A0A3D8P6F3_9THEO|nr:50S ribosomal protein L10 [Ammonifex thiophilus]RDV84913.1 50S ribosomal protein L10 [Ammonifex thiophilus]